MARKLFPIMFALWAALLALAFFTALFAAEKAIGEAVERATRQTAAYHVCMQDAIATRPVPLPPADEEHTMKIGCDLAANASELALTRRTATGELEFLNDDNVPICRDFDDDCPSLNHLACYLYDPAKGKCPFLSIWRKGDTP